jgi:hypothetical protein
MQWRSSSLRSMLTLPPTDPWLPSVMRTLVCAPAFSNGMEHCMRRRFKQIDPLDKRLQQYAQRLRDLAAAAGIERERLLRLARQAETASHIDQWLASPGLRPPT